MPYKTKPGEISLFENDKMGHETAPDLQGYIVAHRDIAAGEKLSISLWVANPNSGRAFGGQITDSRRASKKQLTNLTDLFGNPITVVTKGKGP